MCEGVRVRTRSPGSARVRPARRRRLLLGSVVAATVMLTGTACATSATSAAVVGDVTITEQSIFDRTAQASAQAGQQLTVDQLAFGNRLFTTQDIRSTLLEEAARQRGVVVTDAQVNAAMAGASAGGTRDARSYRELLLLEALLSGQGSDPIAYTNVKVTVDGARTSTRDQAVEVRRAILAGPAGAPVAAASGVVPLQSETVDLSAVPDQLIDGVLSARPGDVLINPGSDGFYVIRVTDRSEEPAQVSATTILGAQSLAVQRQLGEVALLQRYAEQVGVTVNPRMGVWDPVALQVVPTPTAS